ncbi:glycosyltransferase family 4 protein [Clostridium perfringens]
MRKVYIIYRSFYDMNGENYTIGGIQTYIRKLIKVIKSKDMIPVIVQFANIDFIKNFEDIEVWGVDIKNKKREKQRVRIVLEFLKDKFDYQDILIFATEDIFVKGLTENSIAIQHGVSWDMQSEENKNSIKNILKKNIKNYIRVFNSIKIKNLVCVDYNYINWIKTQIDYIDSKIFVIPNSTNIPINIDKKETEFIKIIFARRFQKYRGTRIFSSVVKEILQKYDNVKITFAGEGPDECYLKQLFENNDKVDFISYESNKSQEVHKNYDIAVVPTLASEGTSLSLLEAMSTKCSVVATAVGGITNIILNRYNGIIILPDRNELFNALEELILNKQLRTKIANNAYLTVKESFNDDIWEKKWGDVLDYVSNKV